MSELLSIEPSLKIEPGVEAEKNPSPRYTTFLLNERENTNGDYTDTARIAIDIKTVIRREIVHRQTRGQAALNYRQLESLEMIATKIARIISGDPNALDHWNDIAGYAKLIVEA